jgi:hypothetical protein
MDYQTLAGHESYETKGVSPPSHIWPLATFYAMVSRDTGLMLS